MEWIALLLSVGMLLTIGYLMWVEGESLLVASARVIGGVIIIAIVGLLAYGFMDATGTGPNCGLAC